MVQENIALNGLSFRLTQAYFAYRGLLEKNIKSTPFGSKVPNGCVSLWFFVMSHDGCTPTQIVRQLGLSKSTVSSQIDQLEQKGLLVRKPSDSDGRSVLVYLTETSKSYLPEVGKFIESVDETLAQDNQEVACLMNGLRGIHSRLS